MNLSKEIITIENVQFHDMEFIVDMIPVNKIKQAVKELKEKIDKIDLDPRASIQDYLVVAQDIIDEKFGDKLT